MKNTLLVLLTLIAGNAFGQSETPIEKEISFYGEGIVYLESGDELTGKIKHSRTEDQHIWLYTEGVKKPMKYKIKEIKEFSIGEDYFFVKVKSNTTTKFAQYLVSKDNQIKLYDATYQSSIVKGGDYKSGFLHPTFHEYWVFFPGRKSAVSIKEISLSKKKVAGYVEDCSELSEKIANKEKGYKISAIVPLPTRLETYKRISEEFEDCN